MFEKAIPIPGDFDGAFRSEHFAAEPLIGNVVAGRTSGRALRALEWNEVTARLNAARDLRLLMRRDSHLNIQNGASSFGDAAATYFAALEDDERSINHDALEHCKASRRIGEKPTGDAATGDARDDR